MTSGIPQVSKLCLGVDKHMLLVRHLAPKILMAENYCGRQQVQRLVWAATAYHKKEGANRHPGVRKHGLQYDGRFRVLVSTWNLCSLNGKGLEFMKIL